jgi:hypothetical protein
LCLGATAQGQTKSESAKTIPSAYHVKQAASQGTQSLTGCVDEQNGHYVLRDDRTAQLVNLRSPDSNDDTWFARYLGHKAQVSGAQGSDAFKVTRIDQVADMCGSGK